MPTASPAVAGIVVSQTLCKCGRQNERVCAECDAIAGVLRVSTAKKRECHVHYGSWPSILDPHAEPEFVGCAVRSDFHLDGNAGLLPIGGLQVGILQHQTVPTAHAFYLRLLVAVRVA